ncbi:MAG: response regulator transcription factor [Pseudomonadota bacterium]
MDQESSPSSRPRILLVEDDPDIARLVALHLGELDLEVEHCDRGDLALDRALQEEWSLLMLDLRLPGIDGLEICRRVRESGIRTPVLMLTSKSSELDRVLGLELGADDYVTKPFSPLELVARVKAILRRVDMDASPAALSEQNLDCGAISIDTRDHRVTVHGREVELTAREFDLLLHFARQPGRVFRRTELLDEVWGYGHDGYEHTVNSHINRLRAKIEDEPGDPQRIVTVWGVGYKFQATV